MLAPPTRLASIMAIALVAGCAYGEVPVRLPPSAPAASQIVVDPSDVAVLTASGDATVSDSASETRADVADALRRAGRDQPRSRELMRVRGTIIVEDRVFLWGCARAGDGLFPCLFVVPWLVTIPFGGVTDFTTVRLGLAIEQGGRVWTLQSEATDWGGLYASSRRRALSAALDRGLAKYRTSR